MILILYKHPQNSQLTMCAIIFSVQFYPKKKFLSLYSNMAAPNMNGRLHMTGVHQNSQTSFHFSRPIHKTLPYQCKIVNRISAMFYETDCSLNIAELKKFFLMTEGLGGSGAQHRSQCFFVIM